jgi:tetratricopeptide (TPR) repeat protein
LTNVTSITGAHRKGLLLSRAAARRSDDLLVQLRARNFEASALVGLREFSAAEAIYTELTATAERIGHLWLHLSVLNNFAIILFFEDRIEEALQRYQQARSLAKRIGEADSEAIATTNVIESLVMLGRLEEASCLALEYHHPTAQLWAAHLTMLLEARPVEVPVRETVSAWYQTLYDLTLTLQRLRSGAYPEVLQRCAEPHEDYAWWWDLLELNARLALKLETDDVLRRLNDPKPHPGIQRQIALEYALWLERFVRFEQPLPSSSTWLLIRHNLS